MRTIDLRSDTVTKPSLEMRRAMAEADVGDDVYGDDPTVNRLQAIVAERLGKEAALFVPSGTMANQIAVRVHTRPGDEVILEKSGHSFLYETGALGGVCGVQAHPVEGERGILAAEPVERAIRPTVDHYARTKLVVLENTSNGGGGTCYFPGDIASIADVAKRHRLAVHLDGARLANAHIACGTSLDAFARRVDSVSLCFSKGLGAPIGSAIAGDRGFIEEAHRVRKMLGGGMRQVGILAAAAIYAFEHNIERLARDHENLGRLCRGLSAIEGLAVNAAHFPTNIAYVEIARYDLTPGDVVARLRAEGVLANALGPRHIRVVTHLDVDTADIDEAVQRFARTMSTQSAIER